MKKYLLAVLLLATFQSFGQFLNYTNINGRYKWIAGKFDSTFTLPSGPTPSLRTGGGNAPGALFYSTTDSVVYEYTGSQWRPLHGSDTSKVQIAYVRNTSGSPMTTGQVVYINGSTGNVPTIALANNKNDSSSAVTFGMVRGAIPNNGFGWITTFGPTDGINTNAFTEGESIYLDSIAGQYTHDKPQAPYHMVVVGYVIKKAYNGIVFVKIQNGYELDELHNVKITGPVLNKSLLVYDSIKAIWVDSTYTAAGLGPSGSGTTNYLPKWTGSSALGNSLIYDNGSSLGIGTTTPMVAAGYNILSFDGATGSLIDLKRTGTSQLWIQTNSTVVAFAGLTNLPMAFSTNGSERMRIFGSTGNISIGYGGSPTDGGYRVDVQGTFRSSLDANINGLTVGKGGGSISDNTAIGFEAINASATGAGNVAIGYRAGRAITSGVYNVLTGFNAGVSLTTGSYNYAYGMYAARLLTTGAQNVLIGYNAGATLTTQNNNVFIGHSSGNDAISSNNVGVGYWALRTLTTATLNTSIGYQSGIALTTGDANIMIGANNALGLTTGSENVLIGNNIMAATSTASQNTIVGSFAGNALSANANTYFGWYAGSSASSSAYNVGIGWGALQNITTGASNTAIGARAGRFFGSGTSSNTTGTQGIFVGYQTRASADGNTNETVIGYDVVGNGSNSVTLGNSSVTKTVLQSGVLIGTSTSAGYALDVNGTARVSGITQIQDVQFDRSGGFQYINFSSSPLFSGASLYRFSNTTQSFRIEETRVATLKRFDFLSQSTDPVAGNAGVYYNSTDNALRIYNGTNWQNILAPNSSGNVGIGTTSPNASSILDVTSTTKGFLPPRMTNAQMVAITTPAAGLVVYDTTNNKLNVYDGTNWVAVH